MPEWDNDNNRGGGDRGRGDNDWNRGGRDNDWDRGRHDNDWNRRGWDNNDWNRGWGDWNDWDKKYKKHKKRHYNYYPGNPAWWYPYWNQWVAPIVNPIFSWFQPYPYGQYPGSAPAIIYP